jgi:hypothetical protein
MHSRAAGNQPRLRDAVLQANTSAGREMFRRNGLLGLAPPIPLPRYAVIPSEASRAFSSPPRSGGRDAQRGTCCSLWRVIQPRTKVKSRLGSTLRVPHPLRFLSCKGCGFRRRAPKPSSSPPIPPLINLSSRAKHRAVFLPLRAAEGAMRREGSAVRFGG